MLIHISTTDFVVAGIIVFNSGISCFDWMYHRFVCISHSSLNSFKATSGLPHWLSGKESTCNVGDVGSIPGSGRSPGGGRGNRLQCSCLENLMDRGAWQAIVHGVTKTWTWLKWLSTHTHGHIYVLIICSISAHTKHITKTLAHRRHSSNTY